MSDIEEVKELKDTDFKEYIKRHVRVKAYKALKAETVKKQGKEKKTRLEADKWLLEDEDGNLYTADDKIFQRDYMEIK